MNDNDILQRLRALSRYEHSDFSIGDEAADEIDRLRKSHRKLHRRCQEAEAALPDYERIIAKPPDGDGVRFVSGSFGRALLASLCNNQFAELRRLREARHSLETKLADKYRDCEQLMTANLRWADALSIYKGERAELAALRKRIEDAPVGAFRVTRTGPRVCAISEDVHAIDGKRVALVVMEDE